MPGFNSSFGPRFEDYYDSEEGLDDADYYNGEFDDYCTRCDDSGFILVCPDDMCRGMGECIHGDGTVVCPNCKGAIAF